MHSDERAGRAATNDSKREMLRLKTPSVGKLFNYLRYCGGRDGGSDIRCEQRERKGEGAGGGFNEDARDGEEEKANERVVMARERI